MKNNRHLLGIILTAFLLAGCSHSVTKHLVPLPKAPAHAAPIDQKWQTNLLSGVGAHSDWNLAPAIDPYFVYTADNTGLVLAQELETGRVIWRVKTGLPLSAGPVLQGHFLIVGSNNGDVWALDTADKGAVKWKATVSSTVLAKPVVDETHVYIQSNDSIITALNCETGAQVWSFSASGPALILRGTSAPAVLGETLFVGTHEGKVSALNKETGSVLWEKLIAMPKGRSEVERMVDIVSDIMVDREGLFASTYQGRVVGLESQSGDIQWQQELSVDQDFSIDNKAVYLTDSAGILYALDRQTGATLWKQDILKGRKSTGPVVMAPFLVVGDAGGYWHWFHLSDGHYIAAQELGDGIVSMPVKSGPWVVGLGRAGNLIAVKQKIR